jgi:hypothetical protein
MIKTVSYKGQLYPSFQAEGNAAQFAIPFAKHVCHGVGFDVGCNREEWSFPDSIPVDPELGDGFDAMNLPETPINPDYIFSSHCLEHLDNWYEVLEYWYDRLTDSGTLFLYLPDYSQVYWRPWNNRKHKNIFTPFIIKDALENLGLKKIYVSDNDLNNSFMAMGEK